MPLVGTRVCALPGGRGALWHMQRVKVTVIPRGRWSLEETVAGVWEPVGVFRLCR